MKNDFNIQITRIANAFFLHILSMIQILGEQPSNLNFNLRIPSWSKKSLSERIFSIYQLQQIFSEKTLSERIFSIYQLQQIFSERRL